MYTKVSRIKQLIRHITGIPYEFPIPFTITGFAFLFICPIAMYLWVPIGSPLLKFVFIPIAGAMLISYFEPETIHPFAWVYAHVRRRIRPVRRVINRPVPRKGWIKEYRQPTILKVGKEGKKLGSVSSK